jgi:hypothetical protein
MGDQIAEAAAWLAACAEASHAIVDRKANAVRNGVRLVYDPPSWAGIPDLSAIYRRGRQLVYDAMASLERQGRLRGIDDEVDRLRGDACAVVRRALALLLL